MGVVLPDELSTVLDLIGVSWPNVDEDDYRDMADALRDFATEIDTGRGDTQTALNRLISTNKGETTAAINAHINKLNGKHLHNLAEASRLLAGGLDGAATLVAGAKGAAVAALWTLAAEVAAAQATAIFTLGLSELAALGGVAVTRTIVKKALKEGAKLAAEEILAVVTAPAFAALENMATDLIVQVVEDGVGIRDGVDLGQTAQAGKDGLQLASVDGGGGGLVLASVGPGGGTGDLVFDEHEHNTFASRTYDHSKHLDEKGGPHLTRSRGHFGRTKGKGDLAQTIENAVEKAMTSLGGAHGKLKTHLNDVGDGLVKAGGGHKARNEKVRDDFKGVKKPDVDGPPAGGGGGGNKPPGSGGGSNGGPKPLHPQPRWHGQTAGGTNHHRRDALDVNGLSPEEQRRLLEQETRDLADEASNARGQTPPGKGRLDSGCAGSLLHNGVITSHTSMQHKVPKNIKGEERERAKAAQGPHPHPAVRDLYDDIKAREEKIGRGHGQCAEVALISDRLHQLDPTGQNIRTVEDARRALDGAVIDTRAIGDMTDPKTGEVTRHGEFLPACDSCKHALPALGIKGR
ncbi:YwqJ-related putative deaminase [Streptomyces sp. XD-27]|uniref:YwqJ-related putative deaminase n=1 Tax=Streptomyces sp. XD-27 TaxID=3062779 RepID=UPI0026F420F8|nr:YwqJ-related putative deaminase [Streptomyces sp. XD-27]WKX72913.1 YwqJ-related putative deaminase [Streptomyces sp. XD-27]